MVNTHYAAMLMRDLGLKRLWQQFFNVLSEPYQTRSFNPHIGADF